MHFEQVTTPFGGRSVTYAMLKDQLAACEIKKGATADKWKLYRALCEARFRLGVTDRALALLNALLSFYPKNELNAEDGLVVFPSNAQLSLRAHGMAEQTIRRHLSVLIDAGLLTRKDSANGKRFARRGRGGAIDEAFGFSLAPLLARSEEIQNLAAEVEAERLQLSRMKERLTICRRDVAKLIETAVEEGASGDWETASCEYQSIFANLPRKPDAGFLSGALEEMMFLKENILNQLEMQIKTKNMSGNPYQNERHIQNSKSDSISESEPSFEVKQGEKQTQITDNVDVLSLSKTNGSETRPKSKYRDASHDLKVFPLGMLLSACPQIRDYGPGGAISSWRDLMGAAVVVRSMLGVSPSAYQDACEILGPENAAAVMACILERAGHINSAGGYLRTLTDRAKRGEFSLGPMIMALMRTNGAVDRKAG